MEATPGNSSLLSPENVQALIHALQSSNVDSLYALPHDSAEQTRHPLSPIDTNLLVSRFLDFEIATCRHTLDITPENHSTRVESLLALAQLLSERYQHSGDVDDIDGCVAAYQQAVELTPDGDPKKPGMLTNLGAALRDRFGGHGGLQDLEQAVEVFSLAVESTSDDDPKKPSRLGNMGVVLDERFEWLGNIQDLEMSIRMQTLALRLTPDGHPEKPSRLNNLGTALQGRFERLGNVVDVEQAVAMFTRAVDLTTDSHPSKPLLLDNLGNALRGRFEHLGNVKDIEQAVAMNARAVDLTSDGHPKKASRLNNLGGALQHRFERFGNVEDLEQAVTMKTRAVDLTSDGHPDKPLWLINLGNALLDRFERLGNVEDIEKAVAMNTRAVDLTSDDHPEKAARLNNLGGALQRRFERLSNLEDLEQTVAMLTRAVDLTSDGHPDKPRLLNNLGGALQRRFERLGNVEDVEQAVAMNTRAVDLTSDGHPSKPLQLLNLGDALHNRFNHLGNLEDLGKAVSSLTYATKLAPKDHADQALILCSLGNVLITRSFSPHAQETDPATATQAFMEAAHGVSGNPTLRLIAGTKAIKLLSHPSSTTSAEVLMKTHDLVLDLVPRVVWLGHSIHRRYEELIEFGTLANGAAADAIAAGEHVRALEWLESGRMIVWSQILHLRAPLDDLKQCYPQLASDLERVSQALENLTGSGAARIETLQEVSSRGASLVGEARSHYSLAFEYERLLNQIRKLDGFESFLRPKKISDLIAACASGPVVVINMHESRCDALVFHHPGKVIHVPLPRFSYDQASSLQRLLRMVLRMMNLLGRCREDTRNAEHHRAAGTPKPKKNPQPRPKPKPKQESKPKQEHENVERSIVRAVLKELWVRVVKPIIGAIKELSLPSVDGRLPHITWCPTGPLVFLPLHAAGIYKPEGPSETVMDVAVSSYSPTLEALLRPRTQASPASSTASAHCFPKILVVSQPNTPGRRPIPCTRAEAGHIQSIFPHSADVLSQSQGTIAAVLSEMRTHSWVHLACHGFQNTADPTASSFALHDGELTLSMLMSTSLPHADLAFLSACQTATGDEKLSEEAVHLTAAMLTVGFKSVIGSMWSIDDAAAPMVAKKFYEVMRTQVDAGGELQPAYALHEATRQLRDTIGIEKFTDWIPFVHFGI